MGRAGKRKKAPASNRERGADYRARDRRRQHDLRLAVAALDAAASLPPPEGVEQARAWVGAVQACVDRVKWVLDAPGPAFDTEPEPDPAPAAAQAPRLPDPPPLPAHRALPRVPPIPEGDGGGGGGGGGGAPLPHPADYVAETTHLDAEGLMGVDESHETMSPEFMQMYSAFAEFATTAAHFGLPPAPGE